MIMTTTTIEMSCMRIPQALASGRRRRGEETTGWNNNINYYMGKEVNSSDYCLHGNGLCCYDQRTMIPFSRKSLRLLISLIMTTTTRAAAAAMMMMMGVRYLCERNGMSLKWKRKVSMMMTGRSPTTATTTTTITTTTWPIMMNRIHLPMRRRRRLSLLLLLSIMSMKRLLMWLLQLPKKGTPTQKKRMTVFSFHPWSIIMGRGKRQ
mmetsp:Transcript_36171/g.67116  ORF Transcript_36171/g.67116 Transcript_36171/m.67116 type:complete len:207 (-) Transcript_36171:3226-3846(-)